MLLLDAFLGLGVPEIVVIVVAIILLLEPKNIVYLKPILKAGYKAWLLYRREVEDAQREMEGMKHSIMEPLEAAKREAESEATAVKKAGSGAGSAIRELRGAMAEEMEAARKEAAEEAARKGRKRRKVSA